MILEQATYERLCSYDNLFLAYIKARKRKSQKQYVLEFEDNLENNLNHLRTELLLHSYRPKPLQTFIIRDPKTRKINKSAFRDRIIHHAIVNILEPIFDKTFIYDSFANRIGKGSLKALERFDRFKMKVSKNNKKRCYVLKADIKHYFEEVSHDVLISIIRNRITDERIIWLIKKVLSNYHTGMPLGNLTSQYFANIYLNELDHFVKHKLREKYYLRYVDDFVILHTNKALLEACKKEINTFLKNILKIELHPNKSKVIELKRGVTFLGFRVFPKYRLLRRSNIRGMRDKLRLFMELHADYDTIYEYIQGWLNYASHANTFKLRRKVSDEIEAMNGISILEISHLERFSKNHRKFYKL